MTFSRKLLRAVGAICLLPLRPVSANHQFGLYGQLGLSGTSLVFPSKLSSTDGSRFAEALKKNALNSVDLNYSGKPIVFGAFYSYKLPIVALGARIGFTGLEGHSFKALVKESVSGYANKIEFSGALAARGFDAALYTDVSLSVLFFRFGLGCQLLTSASYKLKLKGDVPHGDNTENLEQILPSSGEEKTYNLLSNGVMGRFNPYCILGIGFHVPFIGVNGILEVTPSLLIPTVLNNKDAINGGAQQDASLEDRKKEMGNLLHVISAPLLRFHLSYDLAQWIL